MRACEFDPFVKPTTVLSVFIHKIKFRTDFVVLCCHLSNALLLHAICLISTRRLRKIEWEKEFFSKIKILKFISISWKMFIRLCTLPCTFGLKQIKKFKDFVGWGNVFHQFLCDFYRHLTWVRVCGRWVKDNFMSHINIYGGTVIFFFIAISLTVVFAEMTHLCTLTWFNAWDLVFPHSFFRNLQLFIVLQLLGFHL